MRNRRYQLRTLTRRRIDRFDGRGMGAAMTHGLGGFAGLYVEARHGKMACASNQAEAAPLGTPRGRAFPVTCASTG